MEIGGELTLSTYSVEKLGDCRPLLSANAKKKCLGLVALLG
jgi:hypothetical protein